MRQAVRRKDYPRIDVLSSRYYSTKELLIDARNDLEKTLKQLNQSQLLLSQQQRDNIKFNVVLAMSDEIIDWEKSTISKEVCVSRFLKIKNLADWSPESRRSEQMVSH